MSYAALVEHNRKLFRLHHVDALASWDEAAMMPAGGEEALADALVMLRGLIHQRATDKRLSDLFGAARADVQRLSPWQLANLRLMEREWLRATALPQDLVEAMSLAESRCE
jgi:carboxypeptidase Taq